MHNSHSRRADAIVFVLGVMRHAKDVGRFAPDVPITVSGLAHFDQLDAAGFRLTYDEALHAASDLRYFRVVNMSEETAVLVAKIVSQWDRLKARLARIAPPS